MRGEGDDALHTMRVVDARKLSLTLADLLDSIGNPTEPVPVPAHQGPLSTFLAWNNGSLMLSTLDNDTYNVGSIKFADWLGATSFLCHLLRHGLEGEEGARLARVKACAQSTASPTWPRWCSRSTFGV